MTKQVPPDGFQEDVLRCESCFYKGDRKIYGYDCLKEQGWVIEGNYACELYDRDFDVYGPVPLGQRRKYCEWINRRIKL